MGEDSSGRGEGNLVFARPAAVEHTDPKSFHPMQHPIHLHGQRMLVVSRDGVKTRNLVWKDTVIIPTGSTVDLLIDASNPGA